MQVEFARNVQRLIVSPVREQRINVQRVLMDTLQVDRLVLHVRLQLQIVIHAQQLQKNAQNVIQTISWNQKRNARHVQRKQIVQRVQRHQINV